MYKHAIYSDYTHPNVKRPKKKKKSKSQRFNIKIAEARGKENLEKDWNDAIKRCHG